jgi:hypothetical protein
VSRSRTLPGNGATNIPSPRLENLSTRRRGPRQKQGARSNGDCPTWSTTSSSRTRSASGGRSERRTQKDTQGRLRDPARPARTPPPALRTSHQAVATRSTATAAASPGVRHPLAEPTVTMAPPPSAPRSTRRTQRLRPTVPSTGVLPDQRRAVCSLPELGGAAHGGRAAGPPQGGKVARRAQGGMREHYAAKVTDPARKEGSSGCAWPAGRRRSWPLRLILVIRLSETANMGATGMTWRVPL